MVIKIVGAAVYLWDNFYKIPQHDKK